jgi:hypothetical protein
MKSIKFSSLIMLLATVLLGGCASISKYNIVLVGGEAVDSSVSCHKASGSFNVDGKKITGTVTDDNNKAYVISGTVDSGGAAEADFSNNNTKIGKLTGLIVPNHFQAFGKWYDNNECKGIWQAVKQSK